MFFAECKKKLEKCNLVNEITQVEIEEDCILENDSEQENIGGTFKESNERTVEMSKTLMFYIREAIDKWAQQYNMQRLPKDIVFRKALTLMKAWDTIKSDE